MEEKNIKEINIDTNSNQQSILKKNTDESCSMLDFNYKIILELLERKIPEDFQDNEGENDELSQLISNKLSEFKYNME